jgi:predicted  nucleic acid-binding Zn-ribbon protein
VACLGQASEEAVEGGEMLKIQENVVVNIKGTAGQCEKTLSKFVEFIKNFHGGEAWKFGNVPGHEYSMSEVVLDCLVVLKTIKSWPLNRIGLTSHSVVGGVLNSLRAVEANINEFASVQEKLSNESRILELISFFFRSKIDSEDVVNLSEFTINLFNSLEALKMSISQVSFFRKFDGGSDEEIALLSGLISEIKTARIEVQGIKSEIEGRVKEAEDVVRRTSEESDGSAQRVAEMIASLEEKVEQGSVLLTEATLKKEAVDDLGIESSNSTEQIRDLLVESRSGGEQVQGFVGDVENLRAKIEKALSNASDGYETQLGYIRQVEELIKRAEAMVSGATVAGLAQAFSDERTSLEKDMRWAMASFIIGIVFIFLVTILLGAYVFEIPISIGSLKLSGAGSTPALGDEVTIAGVLSRTIILLAPFWLTLFSSRRYRSLFDLRQQYSHKYNMAFSVDGFKQQAPAYQEQIAAWVFHVVSEAPVTNTKKPGRGMDESPILALQELAKIPTDKFEDLLKSIKGLTKNGD